MNIPMGTPFMVIILIPDASGTAGLRWRGRSCAGCSACRLLRRERIESVSLFHNCVSSDEVTTIDLDSGRERVGVTRSRPELNFAGTSAGTHLWKFSKLRSSNWLNLEARVGIERCLHRLPA